MTDRRFIEESFPVKEVGEASVREKNASDEGKSTSAKRKNDTCSRVERI